MVLELIKCNKKGTLLQAKEGMISEEHAKEACDLYMTDELYEGASGKMLKYYRLHANAAHTMEQAFIYDIKCPSCKGMLKLVGRQKTPTDLGLYTCIACNERKEGK